MEVGIPKQYADKPLGQVGDITTYQSKSTGEFQSGVFVTRGESWSWGDQDGKPGNVGLITAGSENRTDSWVTVKWESGSSNGYRVGNNDKYDLAIAIKVCSVCMKRAVYLFMRMYP